MSLWLVSLLAGIVVGAFFIVIAKFGKQEDYLLDDYDSDEAPENVRVIEREIPTIVEKEVFIEIEKLIKDETEINRLRGELENLNKEILDRNSNIQILSENQSQLNSKISEKDKEKTKLEEELSKKDLEILNTKKTIEDVEVNFNIYREESSLKLQEILGERDILVAEKDTLVMEKDTLSTEKENLFTEKEKLAEENRLSKLSIEEKEKEKEKSIQEKEKEKEEISIRLNKDKEKLKEKLKKIEENRTEYKTLFEKAKNSVDTALKDRDHFIKLVDQKDVELLRLKKDSKAHPHVYEGRDEYGQFFDVYDLPKSFDIKTSNKIQEINDKLESGQFAYYVFNTLSQVENVRINDLNQLDEFLRRANYPETTGKYKVYLIFSNKVYPFVIH